MNTYDGAVIDISTGWDFEEDFKGAIRIIDSPKGVTIPVILNGHKIIVDEIEYYGYAGLEVRGEGELTSYTDFINVKMHSESDRALGIGIHSVIADSDRKVGFSISGSHTGRAFVYFMGGVSNSFTGDVYVSGGGNVLVLEKDNNAISVRGDITVGEGAFLVIKRRDQTLHSSRLKLKGGALEFGNIEMELSNSFQKLTVEGEAILNFMHLGVQFKSNRFLYLGDIEIADGSSLLILEWEEGRDFLLVRKDSEHLSAALKKLEFQGYDRNNIHLVDYNEDYWEISGAPEPATYGAILGVAGVVVVAWRRRLRNGH